MKSFLKSLSIVALLIVIIGLVTIPLGFVSCAKDGSLTPAGAATITLASQIVNSTSQAYALAHPTNADAQIAAKVISDSTAGIASIAQANVGKTPAQAQIQQGASDPAVGAAVVKMLPNAPITQSTVDALYTASAQAAAPVVVTQPASAP